MVDVSSLDPEVAGILREIAARPDSTLLRVRRDQVQRTLQEDSGSGSVGLSRAEQQLAALHREELAFALRQAAWLRLGLSAPPGLELRRRITADRIAPSPAARDVSRTASDALRASTPGEPVESATVCLLEDCVKDPRDPRLDVEALCAAAHRLVPSVRGRLIAAQAASWRGAAQTSWLLWRSAIERASTAELLAVCLNNASEAAQALGRLDHAVALCERASVLLPAMLAPAASRMWYAALATDAVRFSRAAAQFQDACAGVSDAADEQVDRFRSCFAARRSPLGPEQRRFVTAQRDRVGREARRLVDAFL